MIAKIAIVLYLPRNESARKPPRRERRKAVPMKSVTILADAALGKCMVPPKYVTKLTAIPIVESLSFISIPVKLISNYYVNYVFTCTIFYRGTTHHQDYEGEGETKTL